MLGHHVLAFGYEGRKSRVHVLCKASLNSCAPQPTAASRLIDRPRHSSITFFNQKFKTLSFSNDNIFHTLISMPSYQNRQYKYRSCQINQMSPCTFK